MIPGRAACSPPKKCFFKRKEMREMQVTVDVRDSGCEQECVCLRERRGPGQASVFIHDIDSVTFPRRQQPTEGRVTARWVTQSLRGPLTQ